MSLPLTFCSRKEAILFLVAPLFLGATVLSRGQVLYAHYPFRGDASDISGRGNHGIARGAELTADRFGNPDEAYAFNGVDNFIAIGSGVKPSFPLTLTAYVKGSGIVMANDRVDNSSYRHGFVVGWNPGASPAGGPSVSFFSGYSMPSTRNSQGITGFPGVDPARWHFLAVVMRSVYDTQWYVDGVLYSGTRLGDGTGSTMTYSTSAGTIGTMQPAGGYYAGALDDIRVYSGALSASQLDEIYDLAPQFAQFPKSQNVSNGASARFTTRATASWPFLYQWYRLTVAGEVLLDGETNDTLVIDPVIPFFAGRYFVKAANTYGVSSSPVVRLHVSEIVPSVGDLVSLRFPTSWRKSYEVLSAPSLTSETWKVETDLIEGIGADVLSNIKPSSSVQFLKIRETQSLPAQEPPVCELVDDAGLRIIQQPSPQRVPIGGTAEFSIAVAGKPSVKFEWYGPPGVLSDDADFFSGTKTCRLTINNTLKLMEGVYWVVVTDGLSEVVSEKVVLAVPELRATFAKTTQLAFPAIIGLTYKVQYCGSLDEDTWLDWGLPVTATQPEVTLDYIDSSCDGVYFRAARVSDP